ncbi:MAG: substrate-binding domain-containing protein, partial [Anaerolineales bacterium]|nr:substrate-binding domain-containing protein [Anaerolineales bacterium]
MKKSVWDENNVGNKQHPDQLEHTQTWSTRPTIGFLTSEMGGPLQRLMWLGASDLAQERDANLIVFPGGVLRDSRGFEAQANRIFDLVTVDRLDGLFIWSATLDWFISREEMAAFCRRYHALPVVSGARAFEGIPTVLMDDYQGMRQIMLHLIEHHGYRRIAFIRGPEGHVGAQERYRAYIETLAAYGIPFDPSLVPLPGIDWEKAAAAAMVRQLLDERHVTFEAVAAANDALAIGVLEALQVRGLSVPHDVAVVGFDDQMDSKCVTPPLTTMRTSHYEMGRQAVELLLSMLVGEHVPDCVTVPARLVVRQSCGCLTPELIEAAAGHVGENGEPFEIVLTARREEILSTMTRMGGTAIVGRHPNWATLLLDTFTADLKGPSSGIFLRELDTVLRQVMAVGDDVEDWHGVLSTLRRQMLPCLSDRAMLCRAEDLWQQARIVIGEATQRVQAYHVVLAEQQAHILREIEAALITTFDVSGLMDALFEGLPRLDIPGVYLSLYQDPTRPTDTSKLILAYNEHGRESLEEEGRCFPSSQLVPDGLAPTQRPHHFIVMPLYFRENQLGFVVFEAGLRDGKSYEALRGQISSALYGALLVQRVQQRTHELAASNQRLETVATLSGHLNSILDFDRLLYELVTLTKETFNYYHVHIYRLNPTGDTLVLVEGYGEVGAQMKREKHSIPLDHPTSLTARVARERQVLLVDDVRDEPDWQPLPLLSQVRSKLAAPIIQADKTIGVLSVYSEQAGGLDEGDADMLRSLA